MFTVCEMRVIHQLLKGNKNQEIADTLGLSEKTVRFHLMNINRKSKTKSRCEFVALYYRGCLKNKDLHFDYELPSAEVVVRLLKSLNNDPNILPRGLAS